MTSTAQDSPPVAGDWWTETASPKAWMSVRDADLLEAFLHRQAEERDPPLRVLEWGGGRSTTWYPRYLETIGRRHLWVTVEHDLEFCEREVEPKLPSETRLLRLGPAGGRSRGPVEQPTEGLWLYAFEAGVVRPDLPDHVADRAADLDAYVELPRLLGTYFDVVVIDGRKRRRCLGVAAEVVREDGFVLLHDAWRSYYRPGTAEYASGRRFGDEWWIGSLRSTAFTDVLPWHALERHRDTGPPVPID